MPSNVSCPNCGEVLRVPEELLGRKVRCAACQNVFTATVASAVDPPLIPTRRHEDEAPPPPRRRPRDEDDEDRGADEDDRDRRRDEGEQHWEDELLDEDRRRRRARRRQRARDKVAGPAIFLIVVGVLGIPSSLLNIAMVAAGFKMPFFAGQPNPLGQNTEMLITLVFNGAFIILSLLTILGGVRLKSLSGKGLAMTGAITAMINCTNGCCLLGIPAGIWAIVVMNSDEVSGAFS